MTDFDNNQVDKPLYKYRSFSNLGYLEAIFERNQMYAAKFEELNDPMEGSYLYNPGDLTKDEVDKLYSDKSSYRILSLSETCNNMLMWSHYAESHSGIAIGVSITETEAKVRPVNYVDELGISSIRGGQSNGNDLVEELLTRKYKIWEYEREQRTLIKKALMKGTDFVGIEIRAIVLGLKISSANEENVNRWIKKYCPNVKVSKMSRAKLDKGLWKASGVR